MAGAVADASPGTTAAAGGALVRSGGGGGGGLPAASAAAPGLPAAPAAPLCAKCGGEARRPRDCEHTGWAAYCTECYVELHYYLNEPGAEGR